MTQPVQRPTSTPIESIYTIVTKSRSTDISPGDSLEIEINASGCGVPDKNKLYMSWSSPDVIDPKNPGRIEVCEVITLSNTTKKYHIKKLEPPTSYPCMKRSITVVFPKIWFVDKPIGTDGLPHSFLEGDYVKDDKDDQPVPPMRLILNTSKDAKPGDYDISFVFTYFDKGRFKQDSKTVPFHVKNRYERNQHWLIPLSIFASLIAVASLGVIPITVLAILLAIVYTFVILFGK